MKKVIILRKIQATIKTFIPPFFKHFSLSLNRKKWLIMRAMRKKLNKQLFTEILQNTCSYKFRKFYSQILMLESLFNKVVSLKVWKLKILMLRVPIYYVLE